MRRRILIDCDAGIDDALALVFAHGSAAVQLAGITTVGGNVPLSATTANALAVRDFIGMTEVPVLAGSPVPLARPAFPVRRVHGTSGLGDARLPRTSAAAPGEAADFLAAQILAAPGQVTLIGTGPLTNVALALRRWPAIAAAVRQVVIMGGSAGGPVAAADFNIAADPEAAAVVLAASWPVTLVGLGVTRLARVTPRVRDRLAGLGKLASELLLPALAGYSPAGGPLADPAGGSAADPGKPAVPDLCAVVHVAQPGVIRCRPARVAVRGDGTTEALPVAWPGRPAAALAVDIDVTRFWDVVLASFTAVAAGLPGAGQPGPPPDGAR